MIQVPLSAVPSQTLAITLRGQACRISVRSLGENLYFDLVSGTTPIVTARICRNLQRLLIDAKYRRFVGDFMFIDTQGDEQPAYTGLNSRWLLYYLEANE